MYVLRRGEGIPVLLVHGVAGDHRVWYQLLREPIEGYRFLAVDLPAHGRSGGEPKGRVEEYAEDIRDALGKELEGAILVGFSMGGGVVASLYSMSPSSFRGLVMVSSAFRLPIISPKVDREGMCRRIYLSARLRRLCLREMGRVPEDVLLADRRAAAYDLLHLTYGVRVPTLFLYGTLDRLVRSDMVVESARRVRGSKVLFLPSSHMIPVESPKALRRALVEFLSAI